MRDYVRDNLGRFADVPGVGDDAINSATQPGGTRTGIPTARNEQTWNPITDGPQTSRRGSGINADLADPRSITPKKPRSPRVNKVDETDPTAVKAQIQRLNKRADKAFNEGMGEPSSRAGQQKLDEYTKLSRESRRLNKVWNKLTEPPPITGTQIPSGTIGTTTRTNQRRPNQTWKPR